MMSAVRRGAALMDAAMVMSLRLVRLLKSTFATR